LATRFELGIRSRKRTIQDTKKVANGHISPVWGEAPTEEIYVRNCVVGDVLDVIMCTKFQNEIFRGYDFTEGLNFPFSY